MHGRLLVCLLFSLTLTSESVLADPDPLRRAVRSGDAAAVAVLLDQGASVDATFRNGLCPLLSAIALGRMEVFQLLLNRGADLEMGDRQGQAALHYAIMYDRLEMAKELIRRGAKVSEPSDSGMHPLRLAVRDGNVEMIQLLLDSGADVNAESAVTPLLEAVSNGDFETVTLLVEKGANVNTPDAESGVTPLMLAANKDLCRLVALLLAKGANLRAMRESEEGSQVTALAGAAEEGAENAARLLVEKGLDPHESKDLPIRLAQSGGFTELAEYLRAPAKHPHVLPMEALLPEMMPPAGIRLRVALAPFTTADYSFKSARKAADFSALLQAAAGTVPEVEWVERAEISKATAELLRSADGSISSADALRLGKWLHAELLITGAFSIDQGDGCLLRLSAVDLERGEVLASSQIVIHLPQTARFAVPEADLPRIEKQLEYLIASAKQERILAEKQKLIAPLFFRNTTATSARTDFIESDLLAAFRAENSSTRRILSFSSADQAAEETMLLLSGLAEASPEAWKKVADYYIWGDYSETDAEGKPFPEVTIEFRGNVWNGVTAPAQFAFVCAVKDLPAKLPEEVRKLLATLPEVKEEASDAARAEVARTLHQRARELLAAQPSFTSTPDVRNWQFRVALLQLAHFFDPLDQAIDRDLLVERWDKNIVFNGPAHGRYLTKLERRSADWEDHVDRFGLTSLNEISRKGPEVFQLPGVPRAGNMVHVPRENIYLYLPVEFHASIANGFNDAQIPDELSNADRRRWCNELAREIDHRLGRVAKEAPESFRVPLDMFSFDYLEPALIVSIGKKLWELRKYVQEPDSGGPDKVRQRLSDGFDAIGQTEAGEQFFASHGGEPVPAPTPVPARVERSEPESREKNNNTLPLPGQIQITLRAISLGENMEVGGGLDQLLHAGGKLWIAAQVQVRPQLRQCGLIFSYDPASRRVTQHVELELPKLEDCSALLEARSKLWIAGRGYGLWSYDIAAGSVRKFTDREGLPGPDLAAAALSGDQLFVGGGQRDKPGIFGGYDLNSDTWSTFNDASVQLDRVVALAAAGTKLLLVDRGRREAPTFRQWDTATRSWSTLPETIASRLTPPSSAGQGIAESVICESDGESGYWIAGGTSLFHLNAETGEVTVPRPLDQVSGVITALHRDGNYLWIATATVELPRPHEPVVSPAVFVADTRTAKPIRSFRLSNSGTVPQFAASAELLWLGVDTRYGSADCLLEIRKDLILGER